MFPIDWKCSVTKKQRIPKNFISAQDKKLIKSLNFQVLLARCLPWFESYSSSEHLHQRSFLEIHVIYPTSEQFRAVRNYSKQDLECFRILRSLLHADRHSYSFSLRLMTWWSNSAKIQHKWSNTPQKDSQVTEFHHFPGISSQKL